MIIVQYTPESIFARAVPDGLVGEFVNDLIEEHSIKGTARAKVSTLLVLDEIRLRVSMGQIDCSEIRFEIGQSLTSLNRHGVIMSGPAPRDYGQEISAKIVYHIMTKRKAERQERKEELKQELAKVQVLAEVANKRAE